MIEKPETYVLNGHVGLFQPREGGFRTSLDSVMLAAACPVVASESVLDMGCGVGAVGLCIKYRQPLSRVTGVDWDKNFIALAERNNKANDFAQDMVFVRTDIREFHRDEKPIYDHIVMNPPFYEAGKHTPSPDPLKQSANGHSEEGLNLEEWLKAAHRALKSRGTLTIIYPTQDMDKIFMILGRRFGASEVFPLWPRAGEASKRVIIRTIKDRQPHVTLHAGLVLHETDGAYTPQAERILRDGEALF
jgi:tRNA1(Val) A37 N6-methylase TrmN6